MFRELLGRLAARKQLSAEELSEFVASIARDELSDSQLSAFLMALLLKGVTQPEVTAIAKAMREHTVVLKPRLSEDMLDTCGTGGGQSTFNISTATAILCAASGIPVAKHGSRSLSSLCGSIDVAEALGIAVDLPANATEQMIEQIGIAFIHAPLFHPVMRRILPVEASLGIKTIFYTLIGPLINPAKAKRHLLGVYQAELLDLTAAVAKDLNFSAAMVVHGADYLDEISLLGPTHIRYLRQGQISSFQITPEQFGLSRCNLKDIRSQPPQASAEQLRQLFSGKLQGPIRDAVLLNSAGALMVGGRAADFAEGIALATHLLQEGLVSHKLDQLVAMSRDLYAATSATAAPARPTPAKPSPPVRSEPSQTKEHVSASPVWATTAQPSAERLWHGSMAATPDGVVVLDGVGRVQACNPAAATQLGVDAVQMIGMSYSALLPEKVRELRQQLVSVQNGAPLARWEDCLNDQYFAMLAISINEGESILLISRDISEQKRLEQSEQSKRTRLKTLIENLPDLIWLTDKTGRFVNCNQRFERFLGAPESAIKGNRVYDFLPPKFADKIGKLAYQALCERRTVQSRLWISYENDGHSEYVEMLHVPFFAHTGALEGVMGIARDITAFKESEEELLKHRAQLELLVEQRTSTLSRVVEQLRQTQDQLVEAEKISALGAVVAGISHELNTPVGNLLTLSGVLHTELDELQKNFNSNTLTRTTLEHYLAKNKQMLDSMERSIRRTAALITNFKQVTADQIAQQRHPFDLFNIVNNQLQCFRPQLQLLQVDVKNDIAPGLIFDSYPSAVEQIVGHLLQNVVNHAFNGQQHAQLQLSAKLTDTLVKLSVIDNGKGMDQASQLKVFDPFFTCQMGKGTGIGLAISKRLAVGVLGGDLTLSSQPNRGCTFTLSIPLQAPGPVH